MKTLTIVLKAFLDSFRIIREAKLKKFYFIPGIAGIILFFIFIMFGNFISLNIVHSLEKFFNLEEYHSILFIFIRVLIWMCSTLFYYLIYKSLLIAILSPALSYVSEKVETHLTGQKYDFTFNDNVGFILRGLNIGIKSFFKQMVGTCIIMLLGAIFPINLSIPFLIFILQGYFTGFSFMDYTLERYQLTSEETLQFVKKQRVYAALCGGVFTLLFFIPFIGIFIAPVTTCVATTKITLDLLKNREIN